MASKCCGLIIIAICIHLKLVDASKFAINEYCEYETFNATCASDEVILMRHARYGRMRVNRCAKQDYGHIGCGADVLGLADARCSGKRQCQVSIPDSTFASKKACPDDLKMYLEATYQCIRVAYPPMDQCVSSRDLHVNAERGYLSSLVAQETGCGTTERPWRIRMQPGQKINVSLLDFGSEQMKSSPPSIKQCRLYAIIREPSAGRFRNFTVCSNMLRESHAYYSATNVLEIGIVRYNRLSAKTPSFLFKYAAVGCPNITAPDGGWLLRNDNSIMIGCNFTKQQWQQKCIGTTWVGDIGNCSQVNLPRNKHMRDTMSPISYGTSILIIIGVALCIGVVVLLFGLLLVKRQTRVLCGTDDAVSDLSDEVEGEKLTTTEAQYVQYQWVKRGDAAQGVTNQIGGPAALHCPPMKDVVPSVAAADIAAIGAPNRDNDYGIVTVNDVRPCTPLLNKGGRSQTLYGHVGGPHCVCAHMSPSACKARHDACRPQGDPAGQPQPQQPSTIARQPMGPQYFLLDPDVIADQRSNQGTAPPTTTQHPVRMFTFRGSRENDLDEIYQMRTFKPPTTSATTTPSNGTVNPNPPAYQVHPKPSIAHVREDKVAPISVPPSNASNCDAAPSSKENRLSREIERTDNQENEIRTQNNNRAANMVR